MTDASTPPPPQRCTFCGSSDFRDEICTTCNQSRRLPTDKEIDTDLPCLRCGYALRGLRCDNSCPECGTPVFPSLHGDFLFHADASWLRSVHIGIRMITGSLIGTAILILVGLVIASSEASGTHLPSDVGVWLSTGCLLIIGVNFLGWWRITMRDEHRFAKSRRRWFVRVASSITMLDSVALFATSWLGWRVAYPNFGVRPEWMLVWFTGLSIMVVWPFRVAAGLFYLGNLCARLPDAGLADRCRGLAVAIISAWGASAFMVLILATMPGSDEAFFSCFMLILGVGALIWNGVYLATLAGIVFRIRSVRQARSLLP